MSRKPKDPARDFDAYAPAYRWHKVETYFHEVEQGFRMTYERTGVVVDVGVYRNFHETKWTASLNVANGPHLFRHGFKTMRTAKVWAECALRFVADAKGDYQALTEAQAEEIRPFEERVAAAKAAAAEVSERQRQEKSDWLDALADSVTIHESNWKDAES